MNELIPEKQVGCDVSAQFGGKTLTIFFPEKSKLEIIEIRRNLSILWVAPRARVNLVFDMSLINKNEIEIPGKNKTKNLIIFETIHDRQKK